MPTLSAVVVIIFVANYFGESYAISSSNLLNLFITTPLIVVVTMLLVRDKIRGDFGKAWLCFTSFIVMWFVAERIWTVYEMVYQVDPWPSEADYFWLAGYPFYFVFTFYYLKPFRSSIPKPLILSAVSTAIFIAGFLAYSIFEEPGPIDFETLLGVSYPILDAASIAPIIIGLFLFMRGQVSFLWSCLFIGMLCFVVADYGFIFLSLDEEYHTGHPIDIPYLWAYLFFLGGARNYAKIFKIRNTNNRFNDQEKLR